MSAAAGAVIDARSGPGGPARAHPRRRGGLLRSQRLPPHHHAGPRPGSVDEPGQHLPVLRRQGSRVLGLAERDRERGAVLVEAMERAGDKRAVLMAILGRSSTTSPRGRGAAPRPLGGGDPQSGIAALVERGDEEGRTRLIEMFESIKTSPACDSAALYRRHRAPDEGHHPSAGPAPDYDAGPAVAQLHALIDAGLSGSLPPRRSGDRPMTTARASRPPCCCWVSLRHGPRPLR